MEFVELIDKNSDQGKVRLKTVNVTLDALKLTELEMRVPSLNLSGFFRDVIEKTLVEMDEQFWINKSVKEKDGKA